MIPTELTILVLTLTVIFECVVALYAVKKWSDADKGSDFWFQESIHHSRLKKIAEAMRRDIDNENELLKSHLSKKPHRCAECGKMHMAEKQILSGRMPGETYCENCA